LWGIKSRIGEMLAGAKEGVKLAISARRIPVEDRRSADILDTVKWGPMEDEPDGCGTKR
jgi:hypothetical protein